MCALKINLNCTLCGDCVPTCPTHSVHEGAQNFVIDSDSCEECGICQQICAVDAIYDPKKVEEEEEESEEESEET